MNEGKANEKHDNSGLRPILGLALDIGVQVAVPLVAGAFLGKWLDERFGTTPWLFLAAVVISIFISVALVYRATKKYLE